MSVFVIAEAGVNHNGSEEMAIRLIDAATEAGADAVKFQTFEAEQLVVPGAEKAEYQKVNTGDGDQFSMLKSLELSVDAYSRLAKHCADAGIEFMSTPFHAGALDMLVELGMRRIKLPSGEITNTPFLRRAAAKGLPVLLSTGMSTMEEVQRAVEAITDTQNELKKKIDFENILTVLHCTSNYPTAFVDANLLALRTMQEQLNLPIGYSDHTEGITASIAAVALGAAVIEKHFTLDRSLPGPDHRASLEPAELKQMVSQIRDVELALGNGVKAPRESELPVRELVRRSVVSTTRIQKGEILSEKNLTLLRPATGISPDELRKIIGHTAARDIKSGHLLSWDDIVQ